MNQIVLATEKVQVAVNQWFLINRGSPSLGDSLLRAARIIAGVPEAEPTSVPWDRLNGGSMKFLITKMREAGYAAATINHTLATVKSLASHLWGEGVIGDSDYQRILAVKGVRSDEREVGREISRDEQKRLLEACADSRERTLIHLFLWGLRRVEIARLDCSDVRRTPEGCSLRVSGKGHKERVIPLRGVAAATVLSFAEDRRGPLFVGYRGEVSTGRITVGGVNWMFKQIGARAGVEDITTHDGRRTFVSEANQAHVDISTIALMAGHSNINTTKRYIRGTDKLKEAAAAALSQWRNE